MGLSYCPQWKNRHHTYATCKLPTGVLDTVKDMKRIISSLLLVVFCQSTVAANIVGNWQCNINGTIAQTINGVRKVSRYRTTGSYSFYSDGTYDSINNEAGTPPISGIWVQYGNRFSVYPDVNALADLIVQACGSTPAGYAFGCSVNNVTAYINGNVNPSSTRLTGTSQQTQTVIYNLPYTSISLFGKFTYRCVPG